MKNENIKLPLIAMKEMVIFKEEIFTIDISRKKSLLALEYALENETNIFFSLQINSDKEFIDESNISQIGVIAKVNHHISMISNVTRLTAQVIDVAKIEEVTTKNPFFIVKLSVIQENMDISDIEEEAFLESLKEVFGEYAKFKGNFMPDILMNILSTDNINKALNKILTNVDIGFKEKQKILEEISMKKKIEEALNKISYKVEILKIENEILKKARVKIDKTQREYFLKEHLKVIQEELGERVNSISEIEEYRNNLNFKIIPEYAKNKIEKEINRLSKIPNSSAEYTVSSDYINFAINLPWGEKSIVNDNIEDIEEILNKEHFGLEKVKERIIEHIAVIQNTKNVNTSIICLLGPPGVGKTSIAKSIANALNIKYNRISLGGLRDEAEIRGHRKTYIGAMAGRIIKSINDTKTNNPLILLDEIDKLSSDFRGDPSAALLEVLDKEQNKEFKDNYLEIPFDISNVLFICTANDISKIPLALKDRLETIYLSSYTTEEKENIASKFLIPKQLKKHNLTTKHLRFNKSAIRIIIDEYTRETGVRELERLIASICRKSIKKIMTFKKNQMILEKIEVNNIEQITITNSNIKEFLGASKFKPDKLDKKDNIGVVCGLAWTSLGGTTLEIEVTTMKGGGKVIITGNVGKVMNESAQAAISYIRSNYKKYNISEDFYQKYDIHIHIPEGAIPKDGPSAGITIVTALVSVLTNKKVDRKVAMTGEVTLRGNVLAIGGLKEKVLAAKRVGVKKVIIPLENKVDLDEIPSYVKDGIQFIMVTNVKEVLEQALLN